METIILYCNCQIYFYLHFITAFTCYSVTSPILVSRTVGHPSGIKKQFEDIGTQIGKMLMSSNLLKASKLTFCRVDVALCPIGWASGFPLEAGSVKRDIDIRSGGCCSIILGYSSHTHPRHSVRAQKASNQPAGKSWMHQRRSAERRKTTSARQRRKTTRNAIPTMKALEDAMWKKSRRRKNGR